MLFLNNICRTCNTEAITLVNILAHKGIQNSPDLTYMLEYCTQTTLKDNSKYPQGICYNCIKQLEICYRFLKRFHLSQNEFEEAHGYIQETVELNCTLEIEKEVASSCESEGMQANLRGSEKKIPELLPNVKCEESAVEISNECVKLGNTVLNTDIHISDISIAPPKHKLEASQAAICHLCHKPFFTTKALNIHLKINHKQKIVFD